MIALTRREIAHVRAVLRRAGLARPAAGGPLKILVTADESGIRLRAGSPDLIAEYSLERPSAPEQLVVPLVLFDACHGKNSDLVHLTKSADGALEVAWSDRGIPQLLVEESRGHDLACSTPILPADIYANPPALWQALADAAATGLADSSRYALDAIQLRGETGEVIATDGRQALVQAGFRFPWSEDVLIAGSGIFGCREIRPEEDIRVGQADGWVYLVAGPWKFWLKAITERRFPDVASIFRQPDMATSRLHLAASDASYLTEALPRLPSDKSCNHPVTLDLNGKVLVRARPEGAGPVTELSLTQSRLEGDPVTLVANRQYVARALQLGFHELSLFGADTPLQCHQGERRFMFALLAPGAAVKAEEDTVRVASPAAPPATYVYQQENSSHASSETHQ